MDGITSHLLRLYDYRFQRERIYTFFILIFEIYSMGALDVHYSPLTGRSASLGGFTLKFSLLRDAPRPMGGFTVQFSLPRDASRLMGGFTLKFSLLRDAPRPMGSFTPNLLPSTGRFASRGWFYPQISLSHGTLRVPWAAAPPLSTGRCASRRRLRRIIFSFHGTLRVPWAALPPNFLYPRDAARPVGGFAA